MAGPYFLWLTEGKKRILLPVACIGGPLRPGPRGKGCTFVLDSEEEVTVQESPLAIAEALAGYGLLKIPELDPDKTPELRVVAQIKQDLPETETSDPDKS